MKESEMLICSAFGGNGHALEDEVIHNVRLGDVVKNHGLQLTDNVTLVDLPTGYFLDVNFAADDIEAELARVTKVLPSVTVARLRPGTVGASRDALYALLEQLPALRHLNLGYATNYSWPVMRLPELREFYHIEGEDISNLSMPNLRYLLVGEGVDIDALNKVLDSGAYPKLEHLGLSGEYHQDALNAIHWPDSCYSVGLNGLWGEDDIACLARQPWAKNIRRIETYWGEYCEPNMFNANNFPNLHTLKPGYEYGPEHVIETFVQGDLSQLTLLDMRDAYTLFDFDDDDDLQAFYEFIAKLPPNLNIDIRFTGYADVELPNCALNVIR